MRMPLKRIGEAPNVCCFFRPVPITVPALTPLGRLWQEHLIEAGSDLPCRCHQCHHRFVRSGDWGGKSPILVAAGTPCIWYSWGLGGWWPKRLSLPPSLVPLTLAARHSGSLVPRTVPGIPRPCPVANNLYNPFHLGG